MIMIRNALPAALLLAAVLPAAALASSDDAWEAMRADVSAKCLAATKDAVEDANAVVDPFGSEHFGLALIRGKAKGADAQVSYICVYDKQAKTVEIGSELADDGMTED